MTKFEVKGLRTQFEKVYKMHGGRFRSVVSGEPVHILHKGRWEDINLDRVQIGEETHYTNLPSFLCTVKSNTITVTGRNKDFWLQATASPPETTYEVNLKGFKSFLQIDKREDAPKYVEFMIQSRNLTTRLNAQGSMIQFFHGKEKVWAMKLPIMYDSAGKQIALDMDTIPGKDQIHVFVSIPEEWLDMPDRAYPVVFDPTHTSTEESISNGGSTIYAVPEGRTYTADTAVCKWKGDDETSETPTETYNTDTHYNSGSASAVFPSLPGSAVFYRLFSWHYAAVSDGPLTGGSYYHFVYANPWTGSTTLLYTQMAPASANVYSSYSYNSGYIGQAATTSCVGTDHPYYTEVSTVRAYLNYYATLHTVNPSILLNGQTSSYTGSISDGTWTSYYTLKGFSGTASNTMNHTIGGSGVAGFIFAYDWTYSRPTAVGYCKAVRGNGSIIECPIASPSDPALEYDCVRIGLSGGSVGCADLVDTDDPEAGPVRVMTSGGVKSWRLVP